MCVYVRNCLRKRSRNKIKRRGDGNNVVIYCYYCSETGERVKPTAMNLRNNEIVKDIINHVMNKLFFYRIRRV